MINRNSYEPLYIQIRKDIEEQILNGTIQIGDKLMSESEMLKYYNVGRVTVRTALAELVSSGCLKKEQGLGTFCVALPNRGIRKNIDVLLNMGDTYFIPYILAGISRVFDARNCNLVLHDTIDSMDNIAQMLLKTVERGTDGIIIQPFTGSDAVSEECRNAVRLCEERKIPLITIDGKFRGIDVPCLMNNDDLGGYIATQHLIKKGHTNILGLFREKFKDSSFRMAGYLHAMKDGGLTSFVMDADKNSFEEVMTAVREKQITAIVFYNDYLAVDYYHKLDSQGIKVGEDISVIGYDNTDLSVTSLPKLTSVTHPKDIMGEKAAQFLLDMIDGKETVPRRYIFEPEIVERDSVKQLNKEI